MFATLSRDDLDKPDVVMSAGTVRVRDPDTPAGTTTAPSLLNGPADVIHVLTLAAVADLDEPFGAVVSDVSESELRE